jgi:hypothetical protein
MHTAEPLGTEPKRSVVEIDIETFQNYKAPGSDQIPAELIQVGGETLQYDIHKLINSIWSKKEFLE